MSSATQLYNQTVKFGSIITEMIPVTMLTYHSQTDVCYIQ
jgi:hypothetical protein